ncbi:MAG: ribonuclease Z [Dongiaceae bacterium]
MKLTVLGAGTALPMPGRSPSGYLLQVGEECLLFDLGPGTLARLAAVGVSYKDLTRVFVSHLHSDHVLDLVTLLQASNATPGWTREEPLELIGCRGLSAFVDRITELFDGTTPESYPVQVTELGTERRDFDGWALETALTGHTPNSIAFRVEADNKTIVYSGDAIECPALTHLARDAGLFVCECSFPRGWKTCDHVTSDGAGRMARTAGVHRLVLSHLYPPAQAVDVGAQASEIYDGEIIVAVDGTAVAF